MLKMTVEQLEQNLPKMPLNGIAIVVSEDWTKPYFGAVPYLDAMHTLPTIQDNYGADSGKSIVTYFLSNAQTWRGPVAKAVKKELNKRIKQ